MRCAFTTEVAACTAWMQGQVGLAADVGGHHRGRGLVGGDRASAVARGGVRSHSERAEEPLVEAILALQQLVDPAQERARLGALDHAVVVGARHRHHLGDAELPELGRVDLREPGRVADRSRGDDRALARHQPRHRSDGADAARVGERDVGALVALGRQRVVARAGHRLVIAGGEAGEVELVGVVDHRHDQRARAVLALHVHGQPEAHALGDHALRLAVKLGVGVGHHRHVAGGLDDRPRDQVREGELLARVLEHAAARVELVHRQRAEAGGRGNRAALVHEAHERGRRAADRPDVGLAWRRGRAGGGWRRGARAVALDRGLHVLLGHAPARAAAMERAHVDAVRAGHPRGHRGGVLGAVA